MTSEAKRRIKRRRSMRLRWRIFACLLGVTAVLISILWLCQTVFFEYFYHRVKTGELKRATEYVSENMENADLQSIINFISSSRQMSIRIIDTAAFKNLYESGESFGTVMYGMGIYELFGIYEEALENGGVCERYYAGEDENSFTAVFSRPSDYDGGQAFGVDRKSYENTPPSALFRSSAHNDLIYAKVKTLSDGSERMIIAETRITPLDSTVSTLRQQLHVVTVFVVILSLIVSFVAAKFISKPIEKLNVSAKRLAGGEFDTHFEGKGYREIEQLSDTLNYTASELGKVEALRRELMSNVSHDMRTPLTMIVGYSEVMRDIPGENTPENIQVIIDEARRLTEFVNSVLDLTKLQSGIEKLKYETVCITELLEKLTARYKMLSANSGYTVLLETDGTAFAECDETKISQVIINLIDNAVNYTGEDKTVRVRQIISGSSVRVEVSDSGDGIPKDELPYIWDRYYRSEGAHRRNISGSGIGLSIVKAILNLHGAKYGAESELGKGSTFWFELKLRRQK